MPYKNPENAKKNKKLYYQKNKELIKQRSREYYEKNKDLVLDRMKRYHIDNRDSRLAYLRKWTEENKDKKKASNKNYYENNKEKIKQTKDKHNKSKRGKYIKHKVDSRRQRNLKSEHLFENPFPSEIQVDYHHINNILTIPIPRTTHRKTFGNNHRDRCNYYIKYIIS